MEELLLELENKKNHILQVGQKLIHSGESGVYNFDFYCNAQLNRSLNILDGFIDLARKDNFIAAFPLVRIHLDTLHRIFGFQLIDQNIDEIVLEIINGKELRKFRNKNNSKPLTDAELNEQLCAFFKEEWVSKIYKAGNSFVHFSGKHIISSSISNRKDEGFEFESVIRLGSSLINEDEKIGSFKYMVEITNGILFFIETWLQQKSSQKHSP